MRDISVQEMVKFLDNYFGKQVEIGTYPVWSVQTYNHFGLNNTENTIMFHDMGSNIRQELGIDKQQILNISLIEGEDIYDSVVSIELENSKIDFTISSMPVKCFKCHKIIEEPYDTKWTIQGVGGYGSKFEDEKLDIPVCDSCLYHDIFGYKDGQFDE